MVLPATPGGSPATGEWQVNVPLTRNNDLPYGLFGARRFCHGPNVTVLCALTLARSPLSCVFCLWHKVMTFLSKWRNDVMRFLTAIMRSKSLGLLCGVGILCQFGGCDLGTITTTQTMDGRVAIIQLIRGAILTPIDTFITNTVNDAFASDDE